MDPDLINPNLLSPISSIKINPLTAGKDHF